MVDVVDAAKRSSMMAGIRGKDTKPELLLRRALHALGFRYRLQVRALPGRPDMMLPRYRAVVFINGCFWHRHEGCRLATNPATRPDFWAAKFEQNVARDRRNITALCDLGWRVAVVWECDLKRNASSVVRDLADWLRAEEDQSASGKGFSSSC